MPSYNEQQSRFSHAFSSDRTLCVTDCSCGRVHFVSANGHGDYERGELEELQAKAKAEPDKYIEETEYDHIDTAYLDGLQLVPDCQCGKYKKYCDWIESHAESLAQYLVAYFKEKAQDARHELTVSEQMASALERLQ